MMKRLLEMMVVCTLCALAPLAARAGSNIDAANPYAYAANTGWTNLRGDGANGAVIGRYYCSGNMYGANIGWIRLGSGTPANGYCYANSSASDYGVNHDGEGNLRGYAYGASDLQECAADTDPLNDEDCLRIVSIDQAGVSFTIVWKCQATRRYVVNTIEDLCGTSGWQTVTSPAFPSSGAENMTQTVGGASSTSECYKIEADIPLF